MKAKDFFERALFLARRAARTDEVPIGAVLVKEGRIIAEASNATEARGRFTAHAEMLCIERATKKFNTKHLNGCTLYVTLEPCPMCRAALQLSRIDQVHFLLRSEKFGRKGKALRRIRIRKLRSGELTQCAQALLQDFFSRKR